jgi:hypothetical protein
MACPTDFELDLNNACRMKCPRGFKYLQEAGGNACVYDQNNAYKVSLQLIPLGATPSAFSDEQTRFANALSEVQGKIQEKIEADRNLQNRLPEFEAQYGAFQSRYAGFNSMKQNLDELTKTVQDLKPMRPKTAPLEIEDERKRIMGLSDENLRVAQVALMTILFCLVIYVVVPVPYAHGIAFLIACVGIAVGIFLMSIK